MVKLQRKSTHWGVDLPDDLVLTTTAELSEEAFEQLCAKNRDLRIEHEADGKVTIMAPVHFDSGFFEGEAFGELRLCAQYFTAIQNVYLFNATINYQQR
jgi:hypothetical protein